MAVAVHITTQNMSKSDYERVIGDLKAAGVGEPEGRRFHAAYGDDEVHVFEVWDSEEQFQAHNERFFATLQGAGVDAGIVSLGSLHSAVPD
jgi:quinol monooxygenase YgiN